MIIMRQVVQNVLLFLRPDVFKKENFVPIDVTTFQKRENRLIPQKEAL